MEVIVLHNRIPNNLFDKIINPESIKIILVCKGLYLFSINGKTYKMARKSILILPISIVFKLKPIKLKSKLYLLAVSLSDLIKENENEILKINNIRLLYLNKFNFSYIAQILRILYWNNTYKKHQDNFYTINAYLLASLINDLDWIRKGTPNNILDTHVKVHPVLISFLQLLEKENMKNKKLKFYASELFMSPSNLRKIIKRETGESPRKLIQRYLLYKSKTLITNQNLSLKNISEELGFSDVSAFSRFFKKQQGMSPAIFRKIMSIKN